MSSLKKLLKNGEIAIGTWITINHPDVVDALSELPFDWFVFDMEHAPIDVRDLEILVMPLRGVNIAPLARVPWNDLVVIKRVLDVGVEGVLIPWVNSRIEAEAAVAASRYPPKGVRGVGPRRCIRYGRRDFIEYYEKFEKDELVVIVQIETAKSLENLEEILSVDGIDVAYIGPMDLSVNLGIPTQYDHPKFRDALKKVKETCEKYDVVPGIHTFNVEMAEKMIGDGFRFVALMSDMKILISGFRELLARFGREVSGEAKGY